MTVDDQKAKEIENKLQGAAMRENVQTISFAPYLSDDCEKKAAALARAFGVPVRRDSLGGRAPAHPLTARYRTHLNPA
jgi:hypothetical protein